MSEPRKVVIDGEEIEVDPLLTVLQACEVAGIEIPRFCYHERLASRATAACAWSKSWRPPSRCASCAMQVQGSAPGPKVQPPEISTNSPMVKKAREGVMEFLLINHPLDCPICDQGGECDLQDQAMAYGVDFSRFTRTKRAWHEIGSGPAGQDPDDALHPVHPLRALCHRGRGRARDWARRARRGCEITSYLEGANARNCRATSSICARSAR